MKFAIVLTIFVASFISISYGQIKIKNPSNIERKDEIVRISKSQLAKIGIQSLPKNSYLNIICNNKKVLSQAVDLDGDGHWDEWIFMTDFLPYEIKNVQINTSKQKEKATVFAHARMKEKTALDSFGSNIKMLEMPYQNKPNDFSKNPLPQYLTEGPTLENDKNAFRLYFDTRNTKDIYGKRQPRIVMDSVGSNTRNSYHHLSDWGMDILHVEKSLGAGSLAIQAKNKEGKDSLLRIGGDCVLKENYHLLNDGPLFASFRIDYKLKILGQPLDLSETLSIWKGQYFYESLIQIIPAKNNVLLVTGIADFFQNKANTLSEKKVITLYSFGQQSENKDELGMAIMSTKKDVVWIKDAPNKESDITRSHLMGQNINPKRDIKFRFYSCWIQTDKEIAKSEASFQSFLQNEMIKFQTPLQFFY